MQSDFGLLNVAGHGSALATDPHLQAMRLAQLEDLQVRTMDALRKTTDTLRQLLSEAVSFEPANVNCLLGKLLLQAALTVDDPGCCYCCAGAAGHCSAAVMKGRAAHVTGLECATL